MQPRGLRILGIPGSIRRASFNRGLIEAAAELAPAGVTVEPYDLRDVPLYDGDLDGPDLPEPVRRLKEAVAAADGVLFSTPEYNYSVPGILKNAFDWASRPPRESPLRHKPVAVMGATTGGFGTNRAQLALRQSFLFTKSPALIEPDVYISRARERFDGEGRLTDEETRAAVRSLVEAFAGFIQRLRREAA